VAEEEQDIRGGTGKKGKKDFTRGGTRNSLEKGVEGGTV
jgi:hypothetical protein